MPDGAGSVASVPNHVHAPTFAHGELGAANCPDGQGTTGFMIHLDSGGKGVFSRRPACVENISGFGIALVVNQMHDTVWADRSLGLNSLAGRAHKLDASAKWIRGCR